MEYLALEMWVFFLRFMFRQFVLTQGNVLIHREQILANALISHAYTSVIWNNVFVWTKVSYLLKSLMTVGKKECSSISPIFEKYKSIPFLSSGLDSFFIFIEGQWNILWNSLDRPVLATFLSHILYFVPSVLFEIHNIYIIECLHFCLPQI
jgi:hypothetical protein